MIRDAVPERYRTPADAARIGRIAACYRKLVGKPLVAARGDVITALWNAPPAILAHGVGDEPRFFFANRAALTTFETDLEHLIGSLSRLSAPEPGQGERQAMLDRAAKSGFIDDYSGIRISAKGRRFEIRSAVIWNLTDEDGTRLGQAAAFQL